MKDINEQPYESAYEPNEFEFEFDFNDIEPLSHEEFDLTDDEDEELIAARTKENEALMREKEGEVIRNEVETDDIEPEPEIAIDADDEIYNNGSESEVEEEGNHSDYYDSDDQGSYYSGSDEEQEHALRRHETQPRFDPTSRIPQFCLGMIFDNIQQLRDAIAKYSIMKRLGVRYEKNEPKRVRVKCGLKCPWVLYCSNLNTKENTLKVVTYHPHHRCHTVNKNKFARSSFLAQLCREQVARQPKITLKGLKLYLKTEFHLNVNFSVCKNTKDKIMKNIIGDFKKEYTLLHNYVEEVLTTNLGSTCVIKTYKDEANGENKFVRMYMCFNGCKKGWLAGCRRVIGVDGCFLKGLCKGQLLCAVGRDGNNQMFPIAWCVCEVENKDNWTFYKKFKERRWTK